MRTLKILVLAGSFTALAVGGPAKKRAAQRKVASVERHSDVTRITGESRRVSKETAFKLGLNGGYANLSSGSEKVQSAREANGANQALSLGLTAHLNFMKYGYVDLDGYYAGNPSARAYSELDRVTGKRSTGTEKVESYGSLGEIGARLPLGKGNVRWTPSLGIGIGYVTVRDQKEGAGVSDENSALGPYLSGGLTLSIGSRLCVAGDATVSVFAKERDDDGQNGSARFVRVRAGAYYRLTDPMTLGLQYTQRTLLTGAGASGYGVKDTTQQVLGSLQLDF